MLEGQTHYQNDGCSEPAHNNAPVWHQKIDDLLTNPKSGLALLSGDTKRMLVKFVSKVVIGELERVNLEDRTEKDFSAETINLVHECWRQRRDAIIEENKNTG